MRRVSLAGLALVGALLLAIPSAFAKSDLQAADPGITATKLTIGGTFPLSGPASTYGPIGLGMKAYFSYINARRGPDGKRGIYGRQIDFKVYDDGFNPVNAVQLTRRLVEDDKVFAVVGSVRTEVNQAVRPYLNEKRVPHVFVSSGASEFGRRSLAKQYPWTIGWQPDYLAESRLYGLDIIRNRPNAKIAILYQNDDYGKEYVYGLKVALGKARADRMIVGEQAYDVLGGATPAPQLVRLRATGADTLYIVVTPTPAVQTYAIIKQLGWQPQQIYLNSVGAAYGAMVAAVANAGAETVNGTISAGYLKDPSAAKWANDATVKQFKTLMAKYYPRGSITDGFSFYGFAKADSFVRAMYKAGRNPTRASLMRAILSLNEPTGYLLPGSRLKTSATDRYPISHQQVQRFNNGGWVLQGQLIDSRPRG